MRRCRLSPVLHQNRSGVLGLRPDPKALNDGVLKTKGSPGPRPAHTGDVGIVDTEFDSWKTDLVFYSMDLQL